ncbi:hypothetical protein, partial [Rhizobium bangladeshense]|uniref:hypothetical protein n=1 Tax=Rhizobium bangladeshense TaxID=1138189 RepID=UPI001C839657
LKAGLWLRRGRFVIMAPVIGIVPGSKAESHLSQMFSFPEPPLSNHTRKSADGHACTGQIRNCRRLTPKRCCHRLTPQLIEIWRDKTPLD